MSAVVINQPPKLRKDTLRIIPLGGLGEVGRNMTAFELNGRLLIVDCGVLFPEDSQPGVDLILPDFAPIADRLDDIDALVLTHGHEDHIGAVPYLLKLRDDIPLIGSRLTLGLTEAKLKEHHITPESIVVEARDKLTVGEFVLEFFTVTHSIPDCLAVAMHTPAGTLLHTGDIKVDQTPIDGRVTDFQGLGRLGAEGVDLLLMDSTNAEVPGHSDSERSVGPAIRRVISEAKQQVIVSTFSSHVHRVQQIADAAIKARRKIVLVGRSMLRNLTIARELGYLNIPDNALVDLKKAGKMPREKLVYICTGSQGESLAALSRIANGSHPSITVEKGDTVLLASSLIPGNETAVSGLINNLIEKGADVIHKGNAKVHVSGHGNSGELLQWYNVVRPHMAMPVHGEVRHLHANAGLAASTGVNPKGIVVAHSGSVIDLAKGRAKITGQYRNDHIFVDGSSVGEITEADLRDRRTLSAEGFITVIIGINMNDGHLVVGPEIQARGLAEDDKVFDDVVPRVERAIADVYAEGERNPHVMQQVVRRTVGRWVSQRLRRKPMIVPIVLPAESIDDVEIVTESD
ncbi:MULTISPECIES: ribonuclease J [unclassified Pseudoclavibacter]|uniref:ribonuclease J n=1 Tax=unclassified Pseudoclavibacter TaxID=2615177 RepID=UPI001CE3D649|nr:MULTISPECIES: ribonuclease J [unclassified Pseudoclavibacter]